MFRDLLAHCSETFTNADITRYTQSLFNQTGMIPLRGRGSFYFVPAAYATLVHSVKSMFETIDKDGWFTLIEMPDLKGAKASVKASFENEMCDRLKNLKAEMQKIQDSKDSLTSRIYRARMEEIGRWAKDLEMYSELTQYTLDDAKETIKEASSMLTKFMETGNLGDEAPAGTPSENVA
jgi:methyl-accepting chemotaxis protein